MASRKSSSSVSSVVESPKRGRGRPRKEAAKVAVADLKVQPAEAKQAEKPSLSAEVASLVSELSGPSKLDGQMYFTRADLHFYERKQLEAANALKDIQLHKLSIEKAKADFEKARVEFDEKVRQMAQQLAQVTATARQKEQALFNLQSALEHKYGVSFKHVLYDADTGRITVTS